ncbi:MAG: hypothetical protein AB8C13_03775 [Phycisphaerales bacterium]
MLAWVRSGFRITDGKEEYAFEGFEYGSETENRCLEIRLGLLYDLSMPILLILIMMTTHPTTNAHSSLRTTSPTGHGSRTAGWVVAAVAVHLLVSSIASAATTCSESMERTRVTRLSHCVAQVIRELVDQNAESECFGIRVALSEPVNRRVHCTERAEIVDSYIGLWILNLPPPAV